MNKQNMNTIVIGLSSFRNGLSILLFELVSILRAKLQKSIKEYKRVSGIFLPFCLDIELFGKIKKDMVFTHSEKPSFHSFINNSRSKQNKKNPEHPFVDNVK